MRIRTQLILASFVLAVVPLAAIVTYSYHSSRRALEAAYSREVGQLTQQMDRRLASIRTDLDQRIRFVSALPVTDAGVNDIAAAMGDATGVVEALEFKPLPAPPAPRPRPEPVQVAQAQQADPEEAEEPAEPGAANNPPELTLLHPAPHPPTGPVLIDIPRVPEMPRYVMSEEQRELIDEVGRLGSQLADKQLDPEEREDLRRELEATQKDLHEVVAQDMRRYREESQLAGNASRDRARQTRQQRTQVTVAAPVPAPAPTPAVAATAKANAQPVTKVVKVSGLTAVDLAKIKKAEEQTKLILGRDYQAAVRKEGEVVGQLTPRINPEQIIRRVLGAAEDRSEIPFAVDREGTVYTRTPDERATLDRLGIPNRVRTGQSLKGIPGWIASASVDEQSGLRIGVARPVGDNLQDLRRTAAHNFVLGLSLIAFALIGIVPLSNHLTRDVKLVTDGAERIAQGDLMTRLPIKTNNELGQLANAFNRMAEDLSLNQQKLLEQERARKEQEIQQRLMTVEYERKSVELEDARRFQLSMLPKEVPRHEHYDIAVYTRTATEVGGDYYDFHLTPEGILSVTIGDATGHGAKAGTMVTVIKTLFSGYDGVSSPADFLRGAAEKIKRMELGRMSMALSLGRLDDRRLTLASAGMPPALVHRAASDTVEEIALSATPLGTLGTEYAETSLELATGDTVLFLSDGFPELMNDASQQFGYSATLEVFATAARAADANGVIASLAETVRAWHGDAPPNDDVTFVVVRVS